MLKKLQVVCLLLTLGLPFSPVWPQRGLQFGSFNEQSSAARQIEQQEQASGENRGQTVAPRQAGLVSIAPTITVSDHKMTGGPIPDQCATPAAKSNFLSTDAQAYQWTLVSGANPGDVMRWEFVQPNGTVYFQTATQPLTISGSVCSAAFMFIAGQAAASLPGNWQVRFIYNGTQLLTENFTISSAPTNTANLLVDDSSFESSLGYPNGAANAYFVNRLTPANYPATLREIHIYFGNRANGLAANTPITLLFAANPSGNSNIDGISFQSFSGTVGGLNHFNVYTLASPLTINSGDFVVGFRVNNPANIFPADRDTTPPSRMRSYSSSDGSDFEIIDSFGATLGGNFGIRALVSIGNCPAVTGINPLSGAIGSSVTITGVNFTGVTAVKFANNIAAQFNVVSDSQITTTTPNGATSGPITISKPNCADAQSSAFNIVSQPVIDVTPASLNYGNVAVGQTKDLQLTVRNTGSALLTVSSIASSNARFTVAAPAIPFNLAPGLQTTVTVRFTPLASGAQVGVLSFDSNDAARPRVDVSLAGTGLAPMIEVTPSSLSFGNVATGESNTLQITLRNTGNVTLNVSSITSNDPHFTFSLLATGFSLPAGGSIKFNVRFAPTSAGSKTAALSINSNDPARLRVDVPMTGTGLAPTIELAPTSLNFGELRLAQTKDLTLSIRNAGTAPLKINSISSSNAQFSVTQFIERPSGALRNLPLNIATGASVEVTVRFRPSFAAASVGPQNGVLSITSNDPNRPRADVALSGTGLGPLLSAPSSLAFGGVTICTAAPSSANLTLSNTGNAPLTIAALSLDNPTFALTQRPALPITVAPGANLTLTLSFYTRVNGAQTGRLIISSNAANNPAFAVALSGVGTPILPPVISQLSVSRTTLSHGRADATRPITPFNPFGLAGVIGFVFPGGPLPANSIAPGTVPAPLMSGFPGLPPAAISSSPDPLHITLAGGATNPIVVSAANIPSCFTLVVAEGVAAPDLTRWERIGTRFGSGNLYATVTIPGTGIFPGMELVTDADLEAYTANSIIFEAPDFGLLVAPAGQNGGTVPLQARARRIPTDPQCRTLLSEAHSTTVEFSRTVRIEILSNGISVVRNGDELDVTVAAQISGNFDPAINTVVRFAYDGDTFDDVADEDDLIPPGASRIVTHTFHVPASDECKLAQLTVVASSTGNVPFAPPPLNPFLVQAPDSIGLFTFRSGGCTVEDTKTVLLRVGNSNCDGGGPAGWIQGTVTDAATGEPIAGAFVSVAGTTLFAITGDDGTYELNNVPAGLRNLDASADGFHSAQAEVNLMAGQIVARNLALQPFAGTITGVVLNAFDSKPIAGATVAVKGTNVATTTGSNGSYTLTNVPVGSQTVDVSAPNFNSTQEIVTVVADQTNARDYFLTPKAGTIKGIVRNATNNAPIAGATVTTGSITATTGGDGSYTLNNVSADAQNLSVTADGFNPGSASLTVPPGQTVNQDFSLSPQLGTLAGIVRDDFNEPIAGATVTAAGVTTTTGSDGSYTLANLPAGAQTVNGSATGYRAASATVTVLANQTAQQDLTLSRLTGTIKGKITNAATGQPINGADVDLLPFPLSFGTSDAGGNYTMTGVPTGSQVILASAPGYYAKLAVVNVVADQTSTQDFALTPQVGTVTGVVFDNFSQPVVGATLSVTGTTITAISNGEGIYTLSNVPVGAQIINVSVPGLRSASVTVNVVANETIYKDIYLETPTGGVRGRVTNAANNQPIVGASILVGIPFGAVYYSAFTDGNGNYALNDVKAGSIIVYAGADGFKPAQATVTIVANQTATQDFALQPDAPATGTITGFVRSTATGNPPVGGATITVTGTNLSTTSTGDGSYTLANVPAGVQTLNATKTGFRTATSQVTVTAGQTVMQNIALMPGTGTVTGTVRNAANADPIVGATITVAGTNISTTSGTGGTYTLNDVPSGAQTLNASATGFSTAQVPVTITEGQSVTQNISLSPTLAQGEIRITLNWSKDGAGHPDDLDAHLIGPNPDGTCFEIAYTNLGNLNAPPFALLEVDNINVSGHPPIETIRIAKLSPGTYRFYVVNFSNEEATGLSNSRATVQIFGSSGQMGSFTVPGGAGRFWTVFEINGQTGAVLTLNQLASPSTSCR